MNAPPGISLPGGGWKRNTMKNERLSRASGLFRTADLVVGLQTLEPRMLLAGDGAQNEFQNEPLLGLDIDQIEFASDPAVNTAPDVSIDKVTQLVHEPEAEGVYEEQNGLVVFEIEDTDSPLGLWSQETAIPGHTGDGYLQFTGNGTASGPPTSPLVFKFKINQSGLYYLHMRAAKDTTHGQPSDHSNDAYIRLDGDYG